MEENGKPRRAAVSSFGVSGTNAHVILEKPAPVGSDDEKAEDDEVVPVLGWCRRWVLSGRRSRPCGIRRGAFRTGSMMAIPAATETVVAVASTWRMLDSALAGRSVFGCRGVVLGGEHGELLGGLGLLAAGESGVGARGIADSGLGGPVFMFSGQGSQWEGMAVELLDSSPLFAEQLRLCGAALEASWIGAWRMSCVEPRARRGWIAWMWCSRHCSG